MRLPKYIRSEVLYVETLPDGRLVVGLRATIAWWGYLPVLLRALPVIPVRRWPGAAARTLRLMWRAR